MSPNRWDVDLHIPGSAHSLGTPTYPGHCLGAGSAPGVTHFPHCSSSSHSPRSPTAWAHPAPWPHAPHRYALPYPTRVTQLREQPRAHPLLSTDSKHCPGSPTTPAPRTAQGHPPPRLHALPRDAHRRPQLPRCPGTPTTAPSSPTAQGYPLPRLHTLPRDAHRCPQLPRCPGTPTATPGSEWYLCT